MSTRFSQYQVLLTGEPVSFWQENMIAIVILLEFSGGNKLSNVRSFIISAIGRGLTSFSKITVLTFLEKKSTLKLSGVSFFLEHTQKL